MSKDSSYKNLIQTFKSINFAKASLFIASAFVIFFVGQIIGIVMLFTLVSMFGYSQQDISDLLVDSPAVQFMGIFFIQLVTVSLIYFVYKYKKIDFFKSLGLDKRLNLKVIGLVICTYGLYFISFLVVAILGDVLIPQLDVNQQQQLGFSNLQGTDFVFAFLALVVMTSIAEEILFRGYLYKNLKKTMPLKLAALVTSVIFAIAHLEFFGDNPLNFIAAIDTFIFSLFLIGLLEKTKTLWSSILFHALKNSIAFVVLFVI
jgi:hypothetical protein